jgi:hypothetical protein
MSKYADVIAKLETATEGNRELDAEIALNANQKFSGWVRHPAADGGPTWMVGELWPSLKEFVDWRDNQHGAAAPCDQAPPYTHSIDAALTLVPNQWWVTIDQYIVKANADPRKWRVWLKYLGDPESDHPKLFEVFSPSYTPALALCIAALKARAVSGAA